MIRKIAPLWLWGITTSLLLFITVGSSIGYTIWYVQRMEQVQCSALNSIIHDSQLRNTKFLGELSDWARSYRCPQD